MRYKTLLVQMYQPFAHYRHPKVMQDDYISTLNIPSPTTITGMLSYISDIRFEKAINIGILSKYTTKQMNFIRGEFSEFWKGYNSISKNNINSGLKYLEYKCNISKNRIMNYEVLSDVEHIIFIKADEEILIKLKDSLNNPKRYIALGRKEDFAILGKRIKKQNNNFIVKRTLAEIVEVEEKYIKNTVDSIKDNIKLINTYVKINLFKEKDESLLGAGNLISLPRKYKDLKADKKDRVLEFAHYIELNDSGYFPKDRKVNIYKNDNQNIAFTWLVGD